MREIQAKSSGSTKRSMLCSISGGSSVSSAIVADASTPFPGSGGRTIRSMDTDFLLGKVLQQQPKFLVSKGTAIK